MADEQDTLVESKASAEVQAEAEKMGWIPPSRYKNDPERFVDADEYIKRGETVLPIVKKELAKVREENLGLRTEYQKTQDALKDALERLDTIEERHSVETQRAVEAAKRGLKAQLAEASEAGDHAAVAEITQQMVDLSTAEEAPPEKKKEPAKVEEQSPFTPAQQAEMDAWNARNPWFGTDKKRTRRAIMIAAELREDGNQKQGAAFYDDVAAEVERTFAPAADEKPQTDKVEGARSSGEGSRQASTTKGYQHLTADAKAACDQDLRKFVGPDKKYKDAASYRANWASIYFSQESK